MKRNNRQTDLAPALAFLAPNFLGFLIFLAGPLIFSFVVSFTDWNLGNRSKFNFTGLENLNELIHDSDFWVYFANTIYLMIGLPISIAGSLILALLLSQKLRGMTVYRTVFYLPTFTSGVALIILWKALYNPDFGPINTAISWFGATPPQWLTSTHNLLALAVERLGFDRKQFGVGARDAILIMGIWIAIGGNNMLLYLAALTNIPQDLYEAAQIDGSGKWKAFWNVTWPQLAPTTFFIIIISTIGGLQGGFEQARVMTQGGPAGTTTTLTYY